MLLKKHVYTIVIALAQFAHKMLYTRASNNH